MTAVTPPGSVALGTPGDVDIAAAVKGHLAAGEGAAARDLYGELVRRHQRKATRIALYYLRESADADEAVQDAFVKAYTHLRDFEYGRSFEVWFTRILVNCCLDRVKARGRRARWMIAADDLGETSPLDRVAVPRESTPEALALRRERGARLMDAIARLPERQKTVVLLSQIEGATTREVSAVTGLRETTIRVHLFRALRRLRSILSEDPAFGESPDPERT